MVGFRDQSNISKYNKRRLRELIEIADQGGAALARLVLQVSEVKTHKKRRLKVLTRERLDLIEEIEARGLICTRFDLRYDDDDREPLPF